MYWTLQHGQSRTKNTQPCGTLISLGFVRGAEAMSVLTHCFFGHGALVDCVDWLDFPFVSWRKASNPGLPLENDWLADLKLEGRTHAREAVHGLYMVWDEPGPGNKRQAARCKREHMRSGPVRIGEGSSTITECFIGRWIVIRCDENSNGRSFLSDHCAGPILHRDGHFA